MKQIKKQIASLLLSACMLVTMLPTVAFAKEDVQGSGTSLSTSELSAFAALPADVALQQVETGTILQELNLPSTLDVTVTTGSATAATVSGDEVATGSEAQEAETQKETTIKVSNWAAAPDYDGNTAGIYTFTPTLAIPEGTTLAGGVTAPQITVTVKETAVPVLRGAEIQPLGTGTGTDITNKFIDAKFLAVVYAKINKIAPEAIYDTDVLGIVSLSMRGQHIESLAGIEYFTALQRLVCDNNRLTSLDVSSNTALRELNCDGNRLTALDVSSNTALTTLNCKDNQLTALDVSSNTALTTLNCYNNQLTALDVSSNTALDTLYCTNNHLTALDVRSNAALTTLYCGGNQLTALDVSSNTALTTLYCYDNQLTALDVRSNAALTTLSCGGNQLTALDVRSNAALSELNCHSNRLTALDVSRNTALSRLTCNGNQLTALDVSNNTALTLLNCTNNQLAALDVSRNTALTMLYCYDNQLTALDVSSNTALTMLYCTNNQLAALDVSRNTALTMLYCYDNQLTALDVSSNTALVNLGCGSNRLTALDVSSNTALVGLDCSSNHLTALDVSSNTALIDLDCSSNYMKDESAVTGLDKSLTTQFIFAPQNTVPFAYSVTVNNGTASLPTAISGANITITANTPDIGKQFKQWTVVSGGVTFASPTAATTTFIMPANTVVVTATYEDIPAGAISVTGVTLNKNSLSLYSNTAPNTATLLATVAPANATDKSVTWQSSNAAVATVDASGNVSAAGNGTAIITATTTDGGYAASCTMTVSTYSIAGSSSGGSSGGGSSPSGSRSPTTTATPKKKPNPPVTAAAFITATVGTNGAANASIPDKSIFNAITKAMADAKAQGKTTNGVSVALNVTMPKGSTALTATLTRSSLNSLVRAGVTNIEVNGAPVTVTFDKKALAEIQKKSSGNISITIAPKVNLSETAKELIGTRPIYNITVGYGKKQYGVQFRRWCCNCGDPLYTGKRRNDWRRVCSVCRRKGQRNPYCRLCLRCKQRRCHLYNPPSIYVRGRLYCAKHTVY